MSVGMRATLLLPLLLASSVAHASSGYPVCDSDPEVGALAVDINALGPSCPVRWLQPAPLAGGVRFELRKPDGTVIHEITVASPQPFGSHEIRHECDGSVVDTTLTLNEYATTFSDAQPGDAVVLIDANGTLLAQGSFGTSACPAIELVPEECQVCAPEASFGCADAGAGRGGLGGLVAVAVALGAVVLRRARRATR
ncbi:MAG: hypothetical protein H6Q90_912 [Deltaproteobacteria bacterium]|nr:hypothetical protein [Deltaproteobacteria bacterium]